MLVDCKHGCVTILNISVWYYPNLCDFTKYTIAVYMHYCIWFMPSLLRILCVFFITNMYALLLRHISYKV